MSSQSYTNRIRILAEASTIKAQYPGRMLSENKILATVNCSLNFNPIVYTDICRSCVTYPPANLSIPRYSGGNSSTQSYIVLDGGNSTTNTSNILSGS